jgi:hypothetical protein
MRALEKPLPHATANAHIITRKSPLNRADLRGK